MRAFAPTFSLYASEHRSREEFAILVFVEPGALDIKETQPGEPGEREGVDGELREGAVRPGIGLVVEDMHGPVANLQEVDMAGNGEAEFLVSVICRAPRCRSVSALDCRTSPAWPMTPTPNE